MIQPRLALLLALAVVACAARGPVTRVVVAHRGAILRTISDPDTLRAFERAWLSREEIHLPDAADWQYKLTVGAGHDSQIWLYDPTGYAQLLTVKNTPTYRLPDSAAFNALLGVPNRALQPTRAANPNDQREPARRGPRG